ncbi:hypothetical protein [Maritimibacter sp. HL-12]|uniref:hypothetical protein n=1 Tax=Maritimibacter sp. HL-12 TaxID=1162418 RepID=UPI000A0F3952|nr:hypothetical protein [Maritimibacter sp. HL-12]SMH58101.1 hypothetical protein SAMN05661107_3534 [Maritimibacter sp. HL-12]
MLNIAYPQTSPLRGNLYLNIEFDNGLPQVVSSEFRQETPEAPPDEQAIPRYFNSRLLAAVRGTDRSTSAIDALVLDLRSLAGRSPDLFFSALAPKLMGRERCHLARQRIDVYPLRPDLALNHSVKLVDGWYLGTNIKNDQKIHFLKIACEIRGVKPAPAQKSAGGC